MSASKLSLLIILILLPFVDAKADTDISQLVDLSSGISISEFGTEPFGVNSEHDTLAVKAAIDFAGENGVVIFDSDTVFLLAASIMPMLGQTWFMDRATLKRANQVIALTADPILIFPDETSEEQSIIDVGTNAASIGFFVGMEVTVSNGTNVLDENLPPITYDALNHPIISMSGNTITVSTGFNTGFPAGATVLSSHTMIFTPNGSDADDFRILGGTIDGNRTNNSILTKWQNHKEVFLGDFSNQSIIGLTIQNAQAEGLVIGGTNTIIKDVEVRNSGGNSLHFSGSIDNSVTGFSSINSNLNGVIPGHAHGGISFSLNNTNAVIDGFIIDGSLLGGIQGIGSTNFPVTIRNGTITGTNPSYSAIRTSPSSHYGISRLYPIDGGQGYEVGDEILLSSETGSDAEVKVLKVDQDGTIESLAVLNHGQGYISVPTVEDINSEKGIGAQIAVALASGALIENMHIIDAGDISIRRNSDGKSSNIKLLNNVIEDTRLHLEGCDGIVMEDNIIIYQKDAASNLVVIKNCENVFMNDQVTGGKRGLALAGDLNNVYISGEFYNNADRGIYISPDTSGTPIISAQINTFSTSTYVNAGSYRALDIYAPVSIDDTLINMQIGKEAIRINDEDITVTNSFIFAPVNKKSINLQSGSSENTISYNTFYELNPITDNGSDNEITNNIILTETPDLDDDGVDDMSDNDIDGDGINNNNEITLYNTNPFLADTDNDGIDDNSEVIAGSDPNNAYSYPGVNDGDLTNDGVVDIRDIMLATQIILGDIVVTNEQLAHGDVAPLINNTSVPDGRFTTGDLLLIQRKALNQISF